MALVQKTQMSEGEGAIQHFSERSVACPCVCKDYEMEVGLKDNPWFTSFKYAS